MHHAQVSDTHDMRSPNYRKVGHDRYRQLAVYALCSLLITFADRAMHVMSHAAAAETPATTPLPDLIARYQADHRDLRSFYFIQVDPLRWDRLTAYYEDVLRQLAGLSFEQLPRNEQIDYLLLRNHARHQIARIARGAERYRMLAVFYPFAPDIVALERARWRMEDVNAPQAAAVLDGLLAQVKNARKAVEQAYKDRDDAEQKAPAPDEEETDGDKANAHTAQDAVAPVESQVIQAEEPEQASASQPNWPIQVDLVQTRRAVSVVRELQAALHQWYDFHAAYRPDFTWWAQEPFAALEKELSSYAEFLNEKVTAYGNRKAAETDDGLEPKDDPATLIGDPIGRDALLEELRFEMVPYTPEELLAIGEAQMVWCQSEMQKAAAEIGYEDWHEALAHVKDNHVEPGLQDDLVSRQAQEAIDFVDEHELVSIPPLCRETWRVQMLSKEGQRTLPFAAYGGQVMLVAYPTIDMAHDKKLMSMRGNNVHFTRIVTPHELIPGHHLQGFSSERHSVHRQMFSTPFYVEGWALHWEMMFWDLGYARSPEDRIGMLFWRMHRAARIVVSLKFHLGAMTPTEMVAYLEKQVGHEHEGAMSEVRRYIGDDYGPLYQCAYMIGGMQINALYDDLVVKSGSMTCRDFHDTVLDQNAIPIELVRAALTNEPLSPDWAPQKHIH